MFTVEQYVIGWSVYLLAVIGLLAVFWRMTRIIRWFYPRQVLRLIAAAFLLTPYSINEASEYLAPAWLMAGLEMVFSGLDGFERAGRPTITAALIALIVYLVMAVGVYVYRRKHPTSQPQVRTEPSISTTPLAAEPELAAAADVASISSDSASDDTPSPANDDLLAEAEPNRPL